MDDDTLVARLREISARTDQMQVFDALVQQLSCLLPSRLCPNPIIE
jgi:hypothetical protein